MLRYINYIPSFIPAFPRIDAGFCLVIPPLRAPDKAKPLRFGLHQGEGLGSVQAFGTGPLRVIRFNWTGSRLEARVLAGNAGRDLGRARVVADGQHYRHRVLGPGQAHFMPLGLELVSRLAGGLDQRLQAGAAGPRNEGERPVRVLREVAGWLS